MSTSPPRNSLTQRACVAARHATGLLLDVLPRGAGTRPVRALAAVLLPGGGGARGASRCPGR